MLGARPLWHEIFIEPRRVSISGQEPMTKTEDAPAGHCILLHGWNSPADYLGGIRRALMSLPQAAPWHFWSASYKTHFRAFPDSARELAAAFARQPHDFSRTVFVTYSMGGLVARQMIASGFPCRALITICSPHEGVAPWVPTHSPGTWALSRRSPHLAALNHHPIDVAARSRYHFFAITYSDVRGHHDDDAIVTASSALGENLGIVARRQRIHLRYGRRLALRGPHIGGMRTRYLAPVIQLCAELFADHKRLR